MAFQIATSNKVAASDNASHGAVTVTTSATSVADANDGRIAISLINFGSVTVYWGKSSAVTTANGIPILAGQAIEERDYTGAVYCIASSGTVNLRYWEVGNAV